MITQEQLDAVEKAYQDFVGLEKTYYDTPENKKALMAWLKFKNIAISHYNLEGFMLAYGFCRQADSQFPLEAAPRPKTQAEINAEKMKRDMYDGSLAGNHEDAENPYGKVLTPRERMIQDEIKAKRAAAEAELAKREEIKKKQGDMSVVPSVEQLIASHTADSPDAGKFPYCNELRPKALSELSAAQIKLYLKRSSDAWRVVEEERQKRIRQMHKDRDRIGI